MTRRDTVNPAWVRDPLLRRTDVLAHRVSCPELGRWIETAYHGDAVQLDALDIELAQHEREA